MGGNFANMQNHRAFVFSHPDCNRRYGNFTRSAKCARTLPPMWNFTNPQRAQFKSIFELQVINEKGRQRRPFCIIFSIKPNYARISATTPEPTVLPPSRIAKRRPFSIAIAEMSSTVISTLSPGRHISTPSGRLITPVTSVVLK